MTLRTRRSRPYFCSRCGGERVQAAIWHNLNEFDETVDGDLSGDERCASCGATGPGIATVIPNAEHLADIATPEGVAAVRMLASGPRTIEEIGDILEHLEYRRFVAVTVRGVEIDLTGRRLLQYLDRDTGAEED